MEEVQIGKKSFDLEPGYVFAPYIPMNTTPVISEYISKNISRKRKINKIFNLDVKDELPLSRSIVSRYSKKIINNNYYGDIEIKNPLK